MNIKQYVALEKDCFDEFISNLANIAKVVAPVEKGYNNFAFEEVKTGSQVALKYIPTILPPKKYFFPQYENISEYDISKNEVKGVLEYEKLIIFGVHTCDLAGIQCLNMAFSDKPKDINYIVRKNKIAIIGLECNDYCDEHASCGLMNTY